MEVLRLLFVLPALVCIKAIDVEHKNEVKEEASAERKEKFFSFFQVVKFTNGPCTGSSSRTGICYTEAECTDRGGSNGGSCAAGFGVCCIITMSCGQQSSENCTYFESNSPTAGCCTSEICPCADNICQLRLDFDNFMITGPTTSVDTVSRKNSHGGDVTANVLNNANTVPVSAFGQCLTDTFSISNPDGPNPPTICGINNGEHMYVESSDCCNKMSFVLGNTGVGTSIATRSWSIKVTQYSCNHPNLAPQGCTQYFFDNTVAAVQSYNYNNGNGIHLANQDQQICVRRERNNCRICWTVVNNEDFAVSGSTPLSTRNGNQCCDYGAPTTRTQKIGFDCIQIPFALTPANLPRVSVFCGNNLGLRGGTSCSTRTPFQLNFRTDKWETGPEAINGGSAANSGFSLVYIMDASNCEAASILNPAG